MYGGLDPLNDGQDGLQAIHFGRKLSRAINETTLGETSSIKAIPLGGQGMIGGPNSWLIESPNGDQILLDCGQRIVEIEDDSPIPKDALPDFSQINHEKLLAVFLSHGHLDHILGILELLRVRPKNLGLLPIYGSSATLKVLRRLFSFNPKKREIRELENRALLIEVEKQEKISDFQISSYPVIHSIPGAFCFVVEVVEKMILYLPDFKLMRSNQIESVDTLEMLRQIGENDIDLMLVDSSNSDTKGYTPSIQDLIANFIKILSDFPNRRIIVTVFASDIETIAELIQITRQIGGRDVESKGKTMQFFFEQFLPYTPDLKEHQRQEPPIYFATGCQAEAYSVLKMASENASSWLTLKGGEDGDVIVNLSRIIPGNGVAVRDMKDRLQQIGCTVIDVTTNPKIHISGHEYQEGVFDTIRVVSPRNLVPIHGGRKQRNHMIEEIGSASSHPSFDEMKAHMVDDSQTIVI